MRRSSIATLAAVIVFCTCSQTPPERNICYADHIVPIVKEDCATCHGNGEYGVRLRGTADDHSELLRYITPFSLETSLVIAWVEGENEHPPIWPRGSEEHRSLEAWIREGATTACFDRGRFGECRFDRDCPSGDCFCPEDEELRSVQLCQVDQDTTQGSCARRENCEEPRFGICATTDGDADADSDSEVDADVDDEPDADVEDDGIVSFSEDIVPMLRRNCASCHSRGQWNVTITGGVRDYDEVMRYVNLDAPEETGSFLWWAAGGGRHPRSWQRGGSAYNLFLEWVNQGALNN